MKRQSCKRHSRSRGFTLVEMLVVLAILVLLVGMVAPRVLKSQKKADMSTAKAQLRIFRSSLEGYAVDMKDFPTTDQGLTALVSSSSEDSESETSSSNWDGPYFNQDAIPEDPWGNQYQYEYPPTRGSGEYPDIWSYGPDGEDDTEDDIVSWSSSEEGDEDDEFEPEPEFED